MVKILENVESAREVAKPGYLNPHTCSDYYNAFSGNEFMKIVNRTGHSVRFQCFKLFSNSKCV